MKFNHCLFAAIAVLSLAACQREAETPVTPAVDPAAAPAAPAALPITAAPESTPVVEQAPMDYGYLCRMSDGAWNEDGQRCEITPALCPTFGTWVDGTGCKSEAAEAECMSDGLQFVEGTGCLIRAIPVSAMRESDFKKG